MEIIKEKVVLARNIVFLCGPYYNSEDISDRRKILQNFIYNEYRGTYLPLVIDDFLTSENIEDPTISIQLLEEIFATISFETVIFLDTMSSATELGLFANNGFKNKILALLPKKSDILNRDGVGYFVKEIVLKQNTDRIDLEYYRPKISRYALASDMVVEHYGFINNIIPRNISSTLKKSLEKKVVLEIEYQNTPNKPSDNNQINYSYAENKNELTVYISIKLLFYLVGSIYSKMYEVPLKKREKIICDIQDLVNKTNQLILNSVQVNSFLPINRETKIIVETSLAYSLYEIIRHFEKFINIYNQKSKFNGLLLIYKPEKILETVEKGVIPKEFFDFDNSDFELIQNVNKNKLGYIEEFSLRRNGKNRNLVKYKEDSNGMKLRVLHKEISNKLWSNYSSSDNSFAYKAEMNVVKCAQKHLDSRSFLKYDISNFFNSIEMEILLEKVEAYFGFNKVFRKQTLHILNTVFFKESLPLGLITSPVISDIYMNDFDCEMEKFVEEKGLKYTRYADDILISTFFEIGETLRKEIDTKVAEELKKVNLFLNTDKKKRVHFNSEGQHIKYLGLNIVYTGANNVLTVGKKYTYEIAKDFMNYKKMIDSDSKFYFGRNIVGRYAFLRQVEGEAGINKIITRLKKMGAPTEWYQDGFLET